MKAGRHARERSVADDVRRPPERAPRRHLDERAWHVLAERVRLGPSTRRSLYTLLIALVASGAWWLVLHYAIADELARLSREALALKFHAALALATLVAIGALLATHARRGWTLGRNRAMGAAMIALFALMTLTGYALYYLVDDVTRAPVSVLHWIAGLLLVPLTLLHVVLGRRSRAVPRRERRRRHPHE
jgi:hypothetical protein